jgi:predicted house-cleaning noncanonical NTP pyrophosphatase (MazG superfamily)
MRYDKLVRDNIPDIIVRNGRTPITHVADDAEYWTKLKEKLREEVDEFMEKPDILEVADILEVVEAICDYKKFGADDVQAAKTKKAEERGRFGKRIILEES